MPVVTERCARNALLRTFDIGVFKSSEIYSTAIKHIYIESASLTDSCNVDYENKDW